MESKGKLVTGSMAFPLSTANFYTSGATANPDHGSTYAFRIGLYGK